MARARSTQRDGSARKPADVVQGSPHRIFAAVAILALLVRVAYLLSAHGPAFGDPLMDADYYDYLGERLARGQGFEPGVFWQPPLYPLFLGGLYRIAGHTLWAPRIVQALLGAATAWGMALLAWRATGARAAAWIAGLAIALHGVLVFYDGELLGTSLAVALMTAALVVSTGPTATRPPLASGTGVLLGLATLAVAPSALLAPAIAAVRARRAPRAAAWTLAGFATILALCAVTNRARGGEWVLVSANGGVNLWIGNNPDGESALAIRPGAGWEALMEAPIAAGARTAAAQDRWFRDRALAFCASHPGACAAGLLHKARMLVASREVPRNEDLYVLRAQSPVLAALVFRVRWIGFPAVVLFPLAAAGAVLLARAQGAKTDETDTRRVLLAALIAACLGPVLFFVTARHRVPVIPLACVAAAVACVEGVRSVRVREPGAWRAVAVCAVVACVSAWPMRYATDDVDFVAEMAFEVGGRRARREDHAGAIESFRRALARRPDYREAGVNLALELARTGQVDAAVATLDDMVQYYPEDASLRAARDRLRDESRARGR